MNSQKVTKYCFLSFRRKPESSIFKELQSIWTPVFTGVTTFCEFIMIWRHGKLDDLTADGIQQSG
ncbi:MAG: hypothetical protein R6U40_08730 [Desulfobacterales bacterium]